MPIKHEYKYIKDNFEKEGYILLSKIYQNNKHKLKYICPNDHQHYITYNDWTSGYRCPYCAGLGKPTIGFIKKQFKKENYTLLTKEYINNYTKLEYICPKGHKRSMSWNQWQQGQRCLKCYHKAMRKERSGKNNPMYGISLSGELNGNWKGGISCEPYCQNWTEEFKEFIKERDNYKCLNPDCWEISKRLTVHHIDYNKKNCEPQNLITLCNSCNSRANKDREWHKAWYETIIYKRYKYYFGGVK